MKVNLGVEVDPKGQAMAWVAELPGCYARGRTAREALEKISLAVDEYCVWLRAHGEEMDPPGAVEVAGVETVQVSVTGLGERAGNTPLEDTVMALKTMFGIDAGIDLTKLYGLSQYVRQAARVPVPPNRGIVGDRLFHVESGIIASWVKNVGSQYLTEAFPFRPEMVGQTGPVVVLGKGSGLDSVLIWLDKTGFGYATDEEMTEILGQVKAISLERKGLLDEGDFVAVASSVLGRTPTA